MKMEYSVFKVEEKKDGRRNLFGTGRDYINLGIVFAEWGLCKELKPKRPKPETTETENSRLISRIKLEKIISLASE
jgi:hypothetical protein